MYGVLNALHGKIENKNKRIMNNSIMTFDEIKEISKALHIGGVSKRYLVKFVDSFWFEHEKTASHFSISELR
jgi:hypothetical protein